MIGVTRKNEKEKRGKFLLSNLITGGKRQEEKMKANALPAVQTKLRYPSAQLHALHCSLAWQRVEGQEDTE